MAAATRGTSRSGSNSLTKPGARPASCRMIATPLSASTGTMPKHMWRGCWRKPERATACPRRPSASMWHVRGRRRPSGGALQSPPARQTITVTASFFRLAVEHGLRRAPLVISPVVGLGHHSRRHWRCPSASSVLPEKIAPYDPPGLSSAIRRALGRAQIIFTRPRPKPDITASPRTGDHQSALIRRSHATLARAA